MKILFDFFPILLFFAAYKFFGIYTATIVAMAASLCQVAYFWFKHHRVEAIHVITLFIILILGSATIWLHNAMFIKWKPTAVYWIFALLFFVTQFIGNRPLIQRMMDSKLTLPQFIWSRLNISWMLFFTLMGCANLYVVYHFSTNTWVNFKLFGTLVLTIAFVIAQSFYIAKHIEASEDRC
ncbi:MAG: septation protein A [Gammaproteobacteria bacterium]|nr:septation protein A [Gammaproteobacteria bacterium]